ncbi:glutathione S-transferase family protein [Aspergillus clavatus NRRL 1]|uniref:Glutathione S-transferase, putative n=1 Tax=Aspergillus clavatus (strain ATCC 1007 / CBS 513.65 / DSM 816 / NCTC 3887 / NRRL 1 / QM 1276 / 107) TaxID=344612 RepID=A1CCM4_ASPCL|nr:glutathione S-transferase, putative [Aspergillus clavatus NRRL 1]EAW12281.1 glutathione S-transferase, putative [Aspergillus clavatus NRRL 1]
MTPPLTLYRGWLSPGQYVWSPFVIKLEARLRFAGLAYESKAGSTRSGPKGKIPYIEIAAADAHAPTALSDSTLIIKELVARGMLPDLNAGLAPAQQAHDLALRALMEEKLCLYHMRERWVDNYYTMRDHILSTLPAPVRVLVGLLIYRGVRATLHGQGTGRFTADEIRVFRREIWERVNGLLVAAKAAWRGGEPFWVLGGEGPSEADFTVFGFIVSVLVCDAAPESRAVVAEFPVVMEYAERIHDRFFPDYEKWDVLAS